MSFKPLSYYLQTPFKFFWGDDIFISYSRVDGINYAEGLASQLAKREFSCRVDLWETSPGAELPKTLKRALRWSKMFVLVGTKGAANSPSVELELDEFLGSGGTIIPLDFKSAMEKARWFPKIMGLPLTREPNVDALTTGRPSENVISRIENSIKFTQRSKRIRQTSIISLLMFVTLIALSVVAAVSAKRALAEARDARGEANGARKDAGEQAARAELERIEAGNQKQAASRAKGEATKQTQNAKKASDQQRIAEEKTRTAKNLERIARANALEQGNIARSRQLAGQAFSYLDKQFDLAMLLGVGASQTPTYEARNFLLTALNHNPSLISFLHPPKGVIHGLAFSPDGKTLVSGGNVDGNLRLWDVGTGRPSRTLIDPQGSGIWSIAFSLDGRTLASGSGNTIVVWDIFADQPLRHRLILPEGADEVYSLAFSPDGKTLASGTDDGSILLWSVGSEKPEVAKTLSGHIESTGRKAEVWSVAFSPDGKILASGGQDGTIRLWDVAASRPVGEPLVGQEHVWAVAFSPNGKMLASGSGSENDSVILWDLATRKSIGQPLKVDAWVRSLTFTSDNNLVVGGDGYLTEWSNLDIQPIHPFRSKDYKGNEGTVWTVAYAPKTDTFASGDGTGLIILWRASKDRTLEQRMNGDLSDARDVAFSPNGKLLATGGADKTVRLWDVETREQVGASFTGHTDQVESVTFSPDGRLLASSGMDKIIRLWNLQTSRPFGEPLDGHADRPFNLAFSPDSKVLASASCEQGCGPTVAARGGPPAKRPQSEIRLWNVASSRRTRTIAVDGAITGIAFSPSGKMLASGLEGAITLWNLETGQPVRTMEDHYGIENIAFSPDGKTLFSGGRDNTIVLWAVSSGKALRPITRPSGEPVKATDMAVKPGGTRLVLGNELWDISTNQQLIEQIGYPSVDRLVLSPDGDTLAGLSNNRVWLWNISLKSLQMPACQIANRNLSDVECRHFGWNKQCRKLCPDASVPNR